MQPYNGGPGPEAVWSEWTIWFSNCMKGKPCPYVTLGPNMSQISLQNRDNGQDFDSPFNNGVPEWGSRFLDVQLAQWIMTISGSCDITASQFQLFSLIRYAPRCLCYDPHCWPKKSLLLRFLTWKFWLISRFCMSDDSPFYVLFLFPYQASFLLKL